MATITGTVTIQADDSIEFNDLLSRAQVNPNVVEFTSDEGTLQITANVAIEA